MVTWITESRLGELREFAYQPEKSKLFLKVPQLTTFHCATGKNDELIAVDIEGGPCLQVGSILEVPASPESYHLRVDRIVSVVDNRVRQTLMAVFRVTRKKTTSTSRA